MKYDYYGKARELAATLEREDLSDWANKILSALEEGVTSTEILMILQWNLKKFLSSKIGSKVALQQAKSLQQKIEFELL